MAFASTYRPPIVGPAGPQGPQGPQGEQGPSGEGGSVEPFFYTVTGNEADLSELVIALPSAQASAGYSVTPAQESASFTYTMRVHTKTTTQFVLSLSNNATVGDVFSFIIGEAA